MEKIFHVYFWSVTSLPLIIWMNNIFFFTIDWLFISDPNIKGTYPDMYNNWLCQIFMANVDNTIFGIFKYYDMFTLRGNFNYFVDLLSLIFLSLWEIIKVFIRLDTGNWQYETVEQYDNIDMNRILTTV
jgi:hypothetical protein